MSLKSARATLVGQIMADWDTFTSLPVHVHNWYDPGDPYHYGLMVEARGQWFRPDDPLPWRTFRSWCEKLGIELPNITTLHREAEKRALIALVIRDWDRSKTFEDHAREWQDLANPLKYRLTAEAMGQRFRVAPIPHTTIQQWIRQLKIDVPVSRRTRNPSKRTLYRWKREDSSRTADGGPCPPDTS